MHLQGRGIQFFFWCYGDDDRVFHETCNIMFYALLVDRNQLIFFPILLITMYSHGETWRSLAPQEGDKVKMVEKHYCNT